MDVHPSSQSSPNLKERTVSDLAKLFESKIKDKVAASPYLRNYRNFTARKHGETAENGVITGEGRTESVLSDIFDGKRNSRVVHVSPVMGGNKEELDGCALECGSQEIHEDSKGFQRMKDVERRSSGLEFHGDQNSGSRRTDIRPVESCDLIKTLSSAHISEKCEIASCATIPHKEEQTDAVSLLSRKRTPEVTRTKTGDRNGSKSKPKRTGSFASGLQRLIRRDKRRGSLDEREIARYKDGGLVSNYTETGSRTTDLSFMRRADVSDKRSDSENSTPKHSFEARRSSDFDLKENEMPKSSRKVKRRKFKKFFRAISFNSVHDVKENRVFLDDEFCCDCRQNGCSQHMSLEFVNAIKDERDNMKNERDRAIEEWTEATSKWELLLDEMDALLVELSQVRKEKDDKLDEFNEITERYEDKIRDQEENFNRFMTIHAEMDAQLTVAKKERIDALTEYDELLKRHYDMKQEIDNIQDDNLKLNNHMKDDEQCIASLQQQVENLQQERDQALQLWNSSVKERKKLHHEMETLIQSRDASLRKAFQLAEDLNKMRESRDALQREVNHSNMTQGSMRSEDRPRSLHGNAGYNWNGTKQVFDRNFYDEREEDSESEFTEFAVSLDRLDSKYGIKVDIAVDEPNVMIVHVGAHVSSKNDIRKYDRILSINGVSVYRSDKKTVEKLLKDCSGRLTMVLRRENQNRFIEERIKDVDITIQKLSGQNSKRSQQNLGIKCKIEILCVDQSSVVSGTEDIHSGDEIININTQDVNKVFEAVLFKLAKKSNGRISLRLKKAGNLIAEKAQHPQLLSPSTRTTKTLSLSDVSESSNHSLASFTSEETAATTDDGGSLFSGSLAPSILYPCNENGNDDDDITALPERLRKLSNPFFEPERTNDGPNSNGHLQSSNSRNGHISTIERSANNERYHPRKNSETRSFRSLKNAYSSRGPKQPLRRARSDAIDRKYMEKSPTSPTQIKTGSNPSICAKSLQDPSEKSDTNSWIMPSPELPRKTGLSENNAINIFATLPRQKKKSVNEADCNKRTTHRVLRLEKMSNESMGFGICGGNKVGIFVKEIHEGSMAALGGMKVGDRLLYLNSFDLNGATLDFATRVILRSEHLTDYRIEVKYEEKFKEIMKEVPRDSLYVRTRKSCTVVEDSQLMFVVGEILHIINTVANPDKNQRGSWQWYAEKVSKKAAGKAGLVPRLDSFIEQSDPQKVPDLQIDPDRTPTNQKKRRRPSAADVKKWLLRKPGVNKTKREKERIINEIENEDRSPYYEILVEK